MAPTGPRTWFLADLDAFYVSVERLRDPSLEGRPVVVGGDPSGRGVVCSASYEARRFGVRSAMPCRRAAVLCPGLTFVEPDFAAYEASSARVFDVLRRFAPVVEPMSLDEAYLDLTGCERVHARHGAPRPWVDVASDLRDLVLLETRLSLSIGVGASRVVAKVAAGVAKPAGVLEVPRGAEAAFLAAMPVEALPGIGPVTKGALEPLAVRTIGDLAALPDDALVRALGRHGPGLKQRALGLDGDDVPAAPSQRSISRDVTFDDDTADRDRIASTLSMLAQRAVASLRADGLLAKSVAVRLRDARFVTREARRRFPEPTDRDHDVLAAVEALRASRHDGRPLRFVGVSLHGLVPASSRQPGLFDDVEDGRGGPKDARLDAAIDQLRARHGFDVLSRALFRAR
jgi:DNA polymerase IV